jgi:hypothetical protein
VQKITQVIQDIQFIKYNDTSNQRKGTKQVHRSQWYNHRLETRHNNERNGKDYKHSEGSKNIDLKSDLPNIHDIPRRHDPNPHSFPSSPDPAPSAPSPNQTGPVTSTPLTSTSPPSERLGQDSKEGIEGEELPDLAETGGKTGG